MKKAFLTYFSPGPAWREGKTSREQPYWTEHAAFMDQIFDSWGLEPAASRSVSTDAVKRAEGAAFPVLPRPLGI